MQKKKKAVGLVSGGLDSAIAVSLVMEQGFEVTGVYVLTPFVSGFGEKTILNIRQFSQSSGFDLKIIETGDDYIELIKHPRYGYGKNINPCIDCHIYMLKKAREVMEEKCADFIFTGEVVGQRGKSQTMKALKIVEKEASLSGKILRPLSARLLNVTEAESKGLIDRNRLLAVKGKTRTAQLAIAREKKLKYYHAPAGGCLLTERSFCKRLEDLIKHKPGASRNDYLLLQLGRHFRISPATKLIIPRNEEENMKLPGLAGKDKFLMTSCKMPGMAALIDGKFNELAMEIFASYISEESIEICIKDSSSHVTARKMQGKIKSEYSRYLL
ncbi:MAG TPA: tRNA 4-thiouridine(8) synthase ThiI [bacterium]|nr:tRNA 4-thiouridine(8) synthase ThiI [bacterium]